MSSQIRLQQNAPGGTPDAGTALLTVGTDGRLTITLPSSSSLPVGNELTVDAAPVSFSVAVASQALFSETLFAQLCAHLYAGAGAGAYTANFVLPVAGMLPGALAYVNIELPASTNPTVAIYDTSTGGTELQTLTNPAPAAAAYWFGVFKFGRDAHWHKLFSAWN
ncbi:MAG: hypothetical protein WCD79_20645 [Chthoniobacteraceae bacterium]